MNNRLTARDLAYCGLFGAAALLFPAVFHLVRLGHVFMPMYLPLVTLAFFVPPLPAVATAFVVPLLSGAVTGMPPFYPPVAVFMSLELAVMSALIAAVVTRRPKVDARLVLVPVLLLGRVLYVALVYAFSSAIRLPAEFMAGLSFLGGWPGIVLMIVVVPPIAGLRKKNLPMSHDAKADFFDGIAGQWDGWEDVPSLRLKLDAGLEELGLGPDEAVLDVGCGTGNLTLALLGRLSPAGRITAVDIAPRMIEEARRKICDPRVAWRVSDIRHPNLPDSSFDRVFCFSVWPHFDDPGAVAGVLSRLLKPGGLLHIWHLSPRGTINEVHASAGGSIHRDLLAPAGETAVLLEKNGFRVITAIDDVSRYLITAIRDGHRP
jgi:ubiquinone/menaquinone biosynthesis C-methylase UbiE